MEWVNEYIKAINEALGTMDFGTLQPFGHLEFEPLIAEHTVEKLLQLIKEAEKQSIPPEELAQLWPTTAGLRCSLYFTLLQMKCVETPKEQRKKVAQFFYRMIKARAVKDVFGRKSNICQTKEQIKTLLQSTPLQKGSQEAAKELGKLYNASYNLCAGLYLDFYLDNSAENEGPYDVSQIYGQGHILVMKKFINIETDIWQERKIPYNNIVIYTVYKDVKYSCDMISVHSRYEGDIINGLKHFAVVADGKRITDLGEIKKITEIISRKSVEQWQELKQLPEEQQKEKAVWIKMQGMQKLFEKFNINWKPTKEMIKAVKDKPLKDNMYWRIPTDKKEAEEYWYKLYHPEIDFYPFDTKGQSTTDL
jgi:hypothetical protein